MNHSGWKCPKCANSNYEHCSSAYPDESCPGGEDLNSPKCIDIKAHLEICSSCQKYFTSVDSTISFYKKYNVELDNEGHNRLLSVLGLDDNEQD